MSADTTDPSVVALRSIALMSGGTRSDFDAVIAPDALNDEALAEPLACRAVGPAGFHATSLWLRAAYADLGHRVEQVVASGGVVAVHTTMTGRHVGPFVVHDAAGDVDQVWAPTGRSFAVSQSHWFRVTEGLVSRHWATRDDLGQSMQLGWVPPTPLYLLRCARAKRRAIRSLEPTTKERS